MFYRRKIILSLLQIFDGQLNKISLQKLLFLFTRRQLVPNYDFVPYHYGCYSFSANADLLAMVRHGLLSEDKSYYTKIDTKSYVTTLNENDKKILVEIKNIYGKLDYNSLMKFTYLNYQYFAINSVKAKEILSSEEYSKVLLQKPFGNKKVLYTIGYEGISLEEYLNRLIKNDVKVLVDVRCNPVSMKFGFSKNQLIKYCFGLNIEYVHFPQLGIQSEQRKELNTQADYNNLFETYKSSNLKQTLNYQKQVFNLLEQKGRIALTCFEANICQCHRKPLAEAITNLPEWKYELKHI